MKIGTKLAVFAAGLSIAAILSMVFVFSVQSEKVLISDKNEKISQNIDKIVADFRYVTEQYRRYSHFIVSDPNLSDLIKVAWFTKDTEPLRKKLLLQQRIIHSDVIEFYDKNNLMTASTENKNVHKDFPILKETRADWEILRRIMTEDKHLRMILYAKVIKDGIFMGTLVLKKNIDAKFLKLISGKNAVIAILERKSNTVDILAASQDIIKTDDIVLNETGYYSDDYSAEDRNGILNIRPFAEDPESPNLMLLHFTDKKDIRKLHHKIIHISLVLGAILGFLASVSAVVFSKRITRHLRQLCECSYCIANGDLTQILKMNRKDEIGELAEVQNRMIASLHQMIEGIIEKSHTLAEGVIRQASNIEETSASLNQIDAMAKNNAENAAKAEDIVTSSDTMIEKAKQSILHSRSMMRLTDSMKSIGESGQAMRKIVKVIDDIAFQIKMLSLNAAIEAARSGDAGAGFSVVAAEVRNLAHRSAEAVRNTTDLISDMMDRLDKGLVLIREIEEIFTRITTGSSHIRSLMNEISAATGDQAAGIDQISKAVSEMAMLNNSHARIAEELVEKVSVFRIREEPLSVKTEL